MEPATSAETPSGEPGYPIPALVVATGVVLLFLLLLLNATQGHFAPQVVDLLLVAQYAKAMAEGHPFQYNPGEAPTTGATSLLHTILLALGHALGARGEGMIAFAIVTGALFFAGSVVLAYRIGLHLAGEREGQLAALMLALSGPVVWGYLYGSDVALTMFLSLLLLERLLAEWNGPRRTGSVTAAALLALTRPECLAIALALGVAWSLGAQGRRKAWGRAMAWAPTAAGLLVLALYKWTTGSWRGTSFADKTLVPNYGLSGSLALAAEYYQDLLRGVLLGFYPSQAPLGFARGWAPYYLPPLALVAILAGLWRGRRETALPLRLWCAAACATAAAAAPNTFMGVHFNRHVLWIAPTLIAVAAVGFGQLTRAWTRGEASTDRRVFAWGVALVVLFGSLSTVRFAVQYADLGSDVWIRDMAAASWIRANLPEGTSIANAATSVEYLTGHRNMNLHGVTSPAFLGTRAAEREAGMFESLERLPVGERPRYLLSSDSAMESQETLRMLADGAPLFRTASFGDELQIHRTRWDAFGPSERIHLASTLATVSGLEEVDRLDVCDPVDEAGHGYRVHSRIGHRLLHGATHVDVYPGSAGELAVMDAGRAILGSESFEISAHPGRDLIMVLRTAVTADAMQYSAEGARRVTLAFDEAGLSLTGGGQTTPLHSFRPGPGWSEVALRVPGYLITGERTRLELRGRYSAFYYWFFQ